MKKLLSCLLLSVILGFGYAQQSALPPLDLKVHLSVSPNVSRMLKEIPPDSVRSVMGNLPFECNYVVTLSDTVGIDSIKVMLGSAVGSNNIVAKSFAFDGATTHPDGTTYSRDGNTVRLYLGTFSGLNSYVAEVRLVDTSGNLTGPIRVIR